MKFGFFSTLDNPDLRLPYNQVLSELTEQTLAIEQAGFNAIWLGEHHFGGEGFDGIPNPMMILSHLAARTTDVRLGLAALIVPQWHPLRVAEDVAMLDQLSGGRVECGVGRGIFPRELTNLNIEADRRNEQKNWRVFTETVDIMKRPGPRTPSPTMVSSTAFPTPASKTATPGVNATPGTAPKRASISACPSSPSPSSLPTPLSGTSSTRHPAS